MANGAGGKTSVGMDENIEGALCYLLAWVTGIIFLVIEKESSFVRFHAMQSIVVFIVITILEFIASAIPFIGWVAAIILPPVGLILWLLLMFKAFKGERFKLPVVGDFAERQVNK